MTITLRVPIAVITATLAGLTCAPGTAEPKQPPHGPSRSSDKKLYIIAPTAFHRALGPFVEHKRRLLPTRLLSLEQALKKSHGIDDPERLKRFLYDAWKHDQLGYALLVGDVDVMPVRYMVLDRVTPAAYDYAFYPSDLYYSDLAKQDGRFDDWNAHKEGFHSGYFGEVRGEKNKNDGINYDDIDYRPDIAVGRWPVSTPREAARVAAKTITYERSILAGKHPGERRAALFAIGGWVDGRGFMDRLARDLPAGWHAQKRYYSDGNRPRTPPADQKELLSLLNRGVGLVLHAGHGSEYSWEGCFALPALQAIHNRDRLPVMVSAGCSTAHFAPLAPYAAYIDIHGQVHQGTDHGEVFHAPPPPPAPYQKGRFNPSGLGEQLLRHGPDGAVAYIGCNTGSQPCGLTLLEGFVRTL
ncbi:MAG TPA: C25 family cysteine peptidase, partial [Gemmataceae bacterium]|nr:C25 family cysteine peptidase [Gemmataceae bacterium]